MNVFLVVRAVKIVIPQPFATNALSLLETISMELVNAQLLTSLKKVSENFSANLALLLVLNVKEPQILALIVPKALSLKMMLAFAQMELIFLLTEPAAGHAPLAVLSVVAQLATLAKMVSFLMKDLAPLIAQSEPTMLELNADNVLTSVGLV